MELCKTPGRQKVKEGKPGRMGELKMEKAEGPRVEVPDLLHLRVMHG
jgi:hypothetical protein